MLRSGHRHGPPDAVSCPPRVAMRMLFYVFVLLAALPVAAYAVLAGAVGRDNVWAVLFGPVEQEAVDFTEVGGAARPNRHLVCPPGWCEGVRDAESPVFDTPVPALREAWFAVVADTPNLRLIDQDIQSEQYVFEARTPVLRFPDTLTVRFVRLDGGRASLAVLGRAHYGHSDLGTNRRRISRLLTTLQRRLESAES